MRFVHPEGPVQPGSLEAVLYTDARGRVVMPRGNTYMPVHFHATPAQTPARRYRGWLEAAEPLADAMKARGAVGTVLLAPDVADVRPWVWRGFRAGLGYTLVLGFPFEDAVVDHSVRKKLKQAARAGYVCERTTRFADVARCLNASEGRQGFSYNLSAADLERARELLGDEHLRAYVCYSASGEPASARVVLHREGACAVDWVAGTADAHLPAGATQAVIAETLADVQRAGAAGFDFAGANHRTVAAAKMNWGATLLPCFTLEQYTARNVAKWGVFWYRALRSR